MPIYLTTDHTTKVETIKFAKAQKSAKKFFSLGRFSQQSMVKTPPISSRVKNFIEVEFQSSFYEFIW